MTKRKIDKCECKNCRRSISVNEMYCPYCSTPNKYFNNGEISVSKDSPVTQRPERKQHPANPLPSFEEIEESITSDKTSLENNYIEDEYINNSDSERINDFNPAAENESQREKSTEDTDYSSMYNFDDQRKKIQWSDEEEKPVPDYTKMYNQNGEYNANYDGYYNDVLPKIANEVDSILAGREKTILKFIFSVFGVVAVIIYLILTI